MSFVVSGVADKENMVKILIEDDPKMAREMANHVNEYSTTPFSLALEGNSELFKKI